MDKELIRALGNVEGELKGINTRLDAQNGAIKGHTTAIQSLPCLIHSEQIQAMEKIIIENYERKEGNKRRYFTRRTQIMAAMIGGLSTGLILLLVRLVA